MSDKTKTKKHGGKRQGAGRKAKTVKTIKSQRGVVILALGSPEYGKMAANAAASIRFVDKKTPIHLVHTEKSISHLTDQHKALFTSMAMCPKSYMEKNKKPNYFKAKTRIYELSPFNETLMIDADLLWFANRPVSLLMNELAEVDFTMQCRGVHDYETGKTDGGYTHWCDLKEARRAYELNDKIYQLSSELVWFKKTKQVQSLFKLVKQIFDNPKVKAVDFAGDIPDELAYNIATASLGIYPRMDREVFIYWDYLDRKANPLWTEIVKKFFGFSIGGNSVQQSAIQRYTQMAKAHANALGLPYHFNIYPKRTWDKSRKTL